MYPINRPQLGAILSFVFGILAFEKLEVSWLSYSYFFLLAFLISLLLSKKLSLKVFLLSLVFFLLGTGMSYFHTPSFVDFDNKVVEGEVIKAEVGKSSLLFLVDKVEGKAHKPFKLMVKKAYLDEAPYILGARYAFKGKQLKPLGKVNLGGFDERAYLKSKGIFFSLKAENKGEFLAPPDMLSQFILKNRAWFKETFTTYLSKEEASFLEAVLFGEKGNLEKDFYALAQKMGLAHLFAVSGLHVGFLALFLVACFKRTAYRNSLFLLFLLGALLLYYTLLVGGVYSAIRASGLIALTFFLKRFYLYRDLPSLLGWLLFLILIFSPFALYDTGLVLSFSLALGLGLFYPALRKHLPKKEAFLPKFFLEAFLLSFVAELISLPLVAHYFYMATLLGILYNFLLVPFFSLIVPLAFLASLLAVFSSMLAKVGFFFLHVALKLFFFVFHGLTSIFSTGHFYVGSPSFYWLLVYGAFLVFFYRCLRKPVTKHGFLFISLLFGLLLLTLPNPAPKDLKLSVVDVGQGSGATYRLSNGKWLVFDTGPSPSTMAQHLRYMGVNQIEAIILSHGDKDHVGGLYELVRDFKVKHLILSEYALETSEGLAFLREVKTLPKLHLIEKKESLNLDKTTRLSLDLVDKTEEANSHEVIAHLKDGEMSYLFLGDTDGRALDEVSLPAPVDILLVPHHGSKNSYSKAFYKRYAPSLALISAGRDNRFSHPHKEVTEGLEDLGISHLKTSEGGGLYFYEKNGALELKRGQKN